MNKAMFRYFKYLDFIKPHKIERVRNFKIISNPLILFIKNLMPKEAFVSSYNQ
jgi:hypothetical protein